MQSKRRLESELLRRVSRSFFLSLRLLPSSFRSPLSLAYLLARATDTLADTSEVAVPVRVELLGEMRRVIRGDGDLRTLQLGIEEEFVALQTHEGERQLLLEFPFCMASLLRKPPEIQEEIHQLMRHIIRGQELDLERFSGAEVGRAVSLQTASELDEYTYLVAGSVGEFWTRLGYLVLAENFPAGQRSEMMELGRHFGQGLQLVNILRDLPEDLANGRCYLPSSTGMVDAEDLSEVLAKAKVWSGTARDYLKQGLEYTSRLKGIRLRMATGLPSLLGLRTLDLLDANGWSHPQTRVKVSRREVRSLLREAFSCSLHPRGWQDLLDVLGERERLS